MDSADVWTEARAAATPGTILVRVIRTMRGAQCFLEFPRDEKTKAEICIIPAFDGATLIDRDDYTTDQREAIIADANAAWEPSTAKRSSHLPLQGEGRDGDGRNDHAGAPA